MLRVLAACSCLLLLVWPVNVAAQQRQQRERVYVERGACPGEACGYGPWKPIAAATVLRARPDSRSRRVGQVRAGPCVTALTGVVRVYNPGRFLVQKTFERYRPGEVLAVYTYGGEEMYKIRHRGRWIAEQQLTHSPKPGPSARRECEANPYCWGVFERRPDSDWWIKVRTPAGLVGWTDEPANFLVPYWQDATDCKELHDAARRRQGR